MTYPQGGGKYVWPWRSLLTPLGSFAVRTRRSMTGREVTCDMQTGRRNLSVRAAIPVHIEYCEK